MSLTTKKRGPVSIADIIAKKAPEMSTTTPKEVDCSVAETAYNFISQTYSSAKLTTPPKLVTNQEQTSNQLVTKTSNKLVTNQEQTSNQLAPVVTSSFEKLVTKLGTELVTNQEQTSNQLVTKHRFSYLVGLQKQIVLLIYKECLQVRDKVTPELSISYIAAACNKFGSSEVESVKKTIIKLQKKKFIRRADFKNGRGGWTKYELEKWAFNEIRDFETSNQLVTNREPTSNKLVSQPVTKLGTGFSSSSSSSLYNNKTTTTDGPQTNTPTAETPNSQTQIDPNWLTLDISGLAEVGFTQTHLIQIARDAKLPPEIVQDSIRHFAFDLRVNAKAKELRGPALNYLMGILRKGFPYAAPENYISPEAEAMKTYLESKKADQERRKTLEDALYELEFTNWTQSLSEEEKSNLAPFGGFGGERGQQAKLSVHFRKTVWPAIKNKSLQAAPVRPKVADTSTLPKIKKDLAV